MILRILFCNNFFALLKIIDRLRNTAQSIPRFLASFFAGLPSKPPHLTFLEMASHSSVDITPHVFKMTTGYANNVNGLGSRLYAAQEDERDDDLEVGAQYLFGSAPYYMFGSGENEDDIDHDPGDYPSRGRFPHRSRKRHIRSKSSFPKLTVFAGSDADEEDSSRGIRRRSQSVAPSFRFHAEFNHPRDAHHLWSSGGSSISIISEPVSSVAMEHDFSISENFMGSSIHIEESQGSHGYLTPPQTPKLSSQELFTTPILQCDQREPPPVASINFETLFDGEIPPLVADDKCYFDEDIERLNETLAAIAKHMERDNPQPLQLEDEEPWVPREFRLENPYIATNYKDDGHLQVFLNYTTPARYVIEEGCWVNLNVRERVGPFRSAAVWEFAGQTFLRPDREKERRRVHGGRKKKGRNYTRDGFYISSLLKKEVFPDEIVTEAEKKQLQDEKWAEWNELLTGNRFIASCNWSSVNGSI